jgi:hypothetical protein
MRVPRRDLLLVAAGGLVGGKALTSPPAAATVRTQDTGTGTAEIIVIGGAVLCLKSKQSAETFGEAVVGFLDPKHHAAKLKLDKGYVDRPASNHPGENLRSWDVSSWKMTLGVTGGPVVATGHSDGPPPIPREPHLDTSWRSLSFYPTLAPRCVAARIPSFAGQLRLTTGTLTGQPPSKRFAREVSWVFRNEDQTFAWTQSMSDGFRYVVPLQNGALELVVGNEKLVIRPTNEEKGVRLILRVGAMAEGEPASGEKLEDFEMYRGLFGACDFPVPHMPGTPPEQSPQRVMVPGKYCTGLRLES